MNDPGNEIDTISLFDFSDEASGSAVPAAKIDVVRLNYEGAERITWQELFSGYNKLHAITFSSGINFVYKLLDMFDTAEVIFGSESVMSYTLHEIMAYQDKLLERMREIASEAKLNLLSRIQDGSVHFYVSRTQLSHEKLYLLEADDGRKRVIMGSANMSYNAFGGFQRENICYVDGQSAYDWYFGVFNELKESSTDEIKRSALEKADLEDNIDELPIAETIKVKRALVIEPVKENTDEIQFTLDVRKAAGMLTPFAPKAEKKSGRLTVVPDTITKLRRFIKSEAVREKELRSEYPQLVVDAFNHTAALNDEVLDLSPKQDAVASDIELFITYMTGYNKFHGDIAGMQNRYFEFANWFFCSPFMATMRDMSARFDQNRQSYPVFGLVYGQSKAGKTSFLETLLKMMIGQKPKVSAPDFTRSSIEGLKRTVKGAPIIVDDLTNTRFNQHAIETIKNDDFGVADHLTHYPAVVISANEDVKAVAPEVIRRTVICRVEAGLTNTEVMKSNVVRFVQQKIGTDFYREYLRRMLDLLPDLIEALKSDDAESAPDILKYSSEIIVDIFREHLPELPDYIRPLSLENYFSEQVTGKYAMKTIQNAWKTSRKSFVINYKNNELRYDAGAPYEADRLLKELPETLEARKSREWLVMDLDEAKHFFEIEFKKSLRDSFRIGR
ncbi:MAG: NgoFVII family restriction endonuclease [Clostridiales bacterium]|nr:NgoFVII family restriction endonuclease [Clostridiales bacterium]